MSTQEHDDDEKEMVKDEVHVIDCFHHGEKFFIRSLNVNPSTVEAKCCLGGLFFDYYHM